MFEYSAIPIKITKQNKNNWPLNYMWHSYNFMQLQYKSLLNLFKNLGKRTQMANNTYNWLFFLSLSNLLCRSWSWKKIKVIMYVFIIQTLLIFMKQSMICACYCLKPWGNGPQLPKMLKKDCFSWVWELLHLEKDHKAK